MACLLCRSGCGQKSVLIAENYCLPFALVFSQAKGLLTQRSKTHVTKPNACFQQGLHPLSCLKLLCRTPSLRTQVARTHNVRKPFRSFLTSFFAAVFQPPAAGAFTSSTIIRWYADALVYLYLLKYHLQYETLLFLFFQFQREY